MMNAAQVDARTEHFPYLDRVGPFDAVIANLKGISDSEDNDENDNEHIAAATAGAREGYSDRSIHEDLDPKVISSVPSVSAHTGHRLISSSLRTAVSVRAVSPDESDYSTNDVNPTDDGAPYQQRNPEGGGPMSLKDLAVQSKDSPAPSQDQQSDEDPSEATFRDIEQSHGDQPRSSSWRPSRARRIPRRSLKSSRMQRAQIHLKRQRATIATDPDAHYIEVPEFSSLAKFEHEVGRHERVLKGRDDPKEVLMDLMFPGEGRNTLEAIKKLQTGRGSGSGSLKRKEVGDIGELSPTATRMRKKRALFFG